MQVAHRRNQGNMIAVVQPVFDQFVQLIFFFNNVHSGSLVAQAFKCLDYAEPGL